MIAPIIRGSRGSPILRRYNRKGNLARLQSKLAEKELREQLDILLAVLGEVHNAEETEH